MTVQVLLGANTGLLNLAATDTAALSQCSFHLLTTRVGGNSVSPTDPEVTMCLQRVRDEEIGLVTILMFPCLGCALYRGLLWGHG